MVTLHNVQLTLMNTPLVEKMQHSLQDSATLNSQTAFNAAVESLYEKRHQVTETQDTHGTNPTDPEGKGQQGRGGFHERQEQEKRKKEEIAAKEAYYAERKEGKIINIEV